MKQFSTLRSLKHILDANWLLEGHKTINRDISLQLDTLRGLSALVVLIAHANQIFLAPVYHGLYGFFGLIAQASVMVFFVLSGFLIFKSITRNYRDNGKFIAKYYAIDRINRIVPPLIFSTVLLVFIYNLTPWVFPSGSHEFIKASKFMAREGFYTNPVEIFGSLVFINGFFVETISSNPPLWSLAFEVWYYFLIALTLYIRGAKGFVLGSVFMILLAILNKTFLIYGVIWFAGSGVALLHNKNAIKPLIFKAIYFIFVSFSMTIAFFYLKSFLGITDLSQSATKLIPLWNFMIGITCASGLALIVNKSATVPVILPQSARFSYTLYIIHFPILLFIYGTIQINIISSIVLSVLVAFISIAGCIAISHFLAVPLEAYRPIKPGTPKTALT